MHLADVPVEVFLHHLLPSAEVRDVLNLGSTNKFFAALTADDPFWKKRCQADFDFTSLETARQFGWKNLYRSLNHPKVFVWGFVIVLVLGTQGVMPSLQRAFKW
jgi:SCF-associated factor 1